mgnify:FL=1|jgi:hypothetical protein
MIAIDFFNVFYFRYYDATFENVKLLLISMCIYSIENNCRINIFIDGYKYEINISEKYRRLIIITYAYCADNEIIKFINLKPSKSFSLVTADRYIIDETKSKICKLIHPRDFLKEI